MMSRADFLRVAGYAFAGAASPLVRAQLGGGRRSMHERIIPSSGERIPVVGCGTWRSFDVGPRSYASRREVLEILFEAGGSVIDSSPMYGAAEEVVGRLLKAMGAHERAFIATKVWTRGRNAGIAQMQRSMELLQDRRVELMQVHNLVDWRNHMETLRAWKAEGRIGYIGVTHYTSSAHGELEDAMRAARPDFVQVNYAVDDRAAEARILPLAAELGIAVIVNRPFGGGGLLRHLSGRRLPDWAREIGCESWPQALLKFVLGHPAVTCVIPGTGRPQHMRENVGAGVEPFPDEALRAKIAASV